MKYVQYISLKVVRLRQNLFLLTMALMLSAPGFVAAQADSAASATDTTEAPELISPSMEIIGVQKADNTIDLKVNLRAKIEGTLTKLSGLKVDFYHTGESNELLLGSAVSDKNGLALLNCKADLLTADKEGKINFKAVFPGNARIEETEEVLALKRAKLMLTASGNDSTRSVDLKMLDVGTGSETTVPEVKLSLYVQRMFSLLKIGEGSTDENGEVTIEIPGNLPGDTAGNLSIIARLEEDELYGNVETSTVQKWGSPVSDEFRKLPRSLWSTSPPMWMLVTFIILMTIVWGHFLVIIFELVRLRKEHI
jgi:hypothetical protein